MTRLLLCHPLFCEYRFVIVPPRLVEFDDLPSVNELQFIRVIVAVESGSEV